MLRIIRCTGIIIITPWPWSSGFFRGYYKLVVFSPADALPSPPAARYVNVFFFFGVKFTQESFDHVNDWLSEVNRYASEGTSKLLIGEGRLLVWAVFARRYAALCTSFVLFSFFSHRF